MPSQAMLALARKNLMCVFSTPPQPVLLRVADGDAQTKPASSVRSPATETPYTPELSAPFIDMTNQLPASVQ